MNFLELIRQIFLVENGDIGKLVHPRNLTEHYRQEIRNIGFDEVCVGGEYIYLERMIEQYKYESNRHISTELVEVMSKCVEVSKYFTEESSWVIVPVPMHWSRYLLRGFHHTARLAKELSQSLHVPCSMLLGTRWTRRQAKLSRQKRITNKKNSFFLKSGYTVPSHIILLDDVISSGSTLNEAAIFLREQGAEKILCFTIASNA